MQISPDQYSAITVGCVSLAKKKPIHSWDDIVMTVFMVAEELYTLENLCDHVDGAALKVEDQE